MLAYAIGIQSLRSTTYRCTSFSQSVGPQIGLHALQNKTVLSNDRLENEENQSQEMLQMCCQKIQTITREKNPWIVFISPKKTRLHLHFINVQNHQIFYFFVYVLFKF